MRDHQQPLLFDERGRFVRNLGTAEVKDLLVRGDVVRRTRTRYHVVPQTAPSDSQVSRAALDLGDMHAVAGLHMRGSHMSSRRRERLSGWGLVDDQS
jgi:hypothetical protein